MTAPTSTATAGTPSPLSQLLAGLNATFSDPSNAGLMGFAQGLLQAGQPHMLTPVTGGQALGMGAASSQQYQAQALQNAMARASVPFQQMKTATFIRAYRTMQDPKASAQDKAAAKALMYSLVGGAGLGTAIYTNDPNVVGPKEAAISQNTPVPVPANERLFGPHGPLSVGAQGSLPEGTAQGAAQGVPGTPGSSALGSLDLSLLPGAAQAMTANAFNKAGGAAAGGYPYSAALSYHTRAPGAAGGTLGPRPPPFAPMPGPGVAGGGQQLTPSPQAVLAAHQAATQRVAQAQQIARQRALAIQQQARQRQMGTMQGISQTAQSAGVPAPFASSLPLSRGSGTNPNPPAPGTLAASQEAWKTPQGRAQVAAGLNAALAAQRARATLPVPIAPQPMAAQLRPPVAPAAGGGLMAAGLSPAQIELQKQAAQQTGAQEAEGGKETEAANQQLARLAEMQNALTQIPVGGNLAKVYQGIGDVLNYAGVKLPGMDAIQEFSKYRTNFVADAARKMGAKVSYQEVGYIAKGVPDFTLQGNAPKALLAQLSGAAQYDIARNQAQQYYATSVPNLYGKPYQGTTRGFEQWWQKTGVTPGAMMFMNTLFALPPADRTEYLQNFRSTTTGKVYLQQYTKAQAFLRSNPGLVPFWSAQQ